MTPFRTGGGRPVPTVTTAEMEAIDRIAVERFGIDLLQMMEHAGRTLAEHVLSVGCESVVIAAGGGGNGGGGLACARHLAARDRRVTVVLDRPASKLQGAAARQRAILDAMDVTVRSGADHVRDADPGVVVDALIGYGLSGDVRGTAATLIDAIGDAGAATVSLDVPSGIDATTGETLGRAVDPDRVLTLALPKAGLAAVDASLFLADIGIPAGVYRAAGVDYGQPFGDRFWIELERVED